MKLKDLSTEEKNQSVTGEETDGQDDPYLTIVEDEQHT